MAETACLTHSLSYATDIQCKDEVKNPLHELNQSVSFGRFASENLSWEKWSTFPNRKYVEEAEKFSRPGSVAQMKAFFDAHYKNVAAKKAVEAAKERSNKITIEKQETRSFADQPITEEKLMEKPLLKESESWRKEKSTTAAITFSPTTPLSSLRNKTPLSINNPSEITKRTPNSSRTSAKERNRMGSSVMSKVPLTFTTPVKPIKEKNIEELLTPQSAMNRENSTHFHSSAMGTKKPRQRWNLLPTDCSKFLSNQGKKTLASPFTFRTDERAARRKEKLEEKFKTEGNKKVNKQPTIKGKAEAEFKKLCGKFCFKATPLPQFYKDRPRKM